MNRLLFTIICLLITFNINCEARVVKWQKRSAPHMHLKTDVRASSDPYITGDSFRAICDHHFDPLSGEIDTNCVKKGDIIFLNSEGLSVYIDQVHPYINVPYILLTLEGDERFPKELIEKDEVKAKEFINSPKLAAWFCMNLTCYNHPKLFPLPIGIGSSYMVPTLGYLSKELIEDIKAQNLEKKYLCLRSYYFNKSGNAPRDILRRKLDKSLRGKNWCKWINGLFGQLYAEYISKSYFVVCPEGVGIETYRFWEVLYSGSYPIITKTAYSNLFKDLPVLVLDDFSQLTAELLLKKKKEFSQRKFDLKKAYFPYWKMLLSNCRRSIQKEGSCLTILKNNK